MTELKECFGSQGMDALFGEELDGCLECNLFDKCHKMTVSICLQKISTDTDLITQNGLTTGKLMGYNKLGEINNEEASP